MTRQVLNTGTTANDGTGDTLRQAGSKINDNFSELYGLLGGDSAASAASFVDSGVQFEGLSANDFETLLTTVEPTQDNTISLPDSTGVVVLNTTTQTLINKTLTSPTLTTPQINDTSADHQYIVAVSELAADRTVTLPLLGADDTFVFASATQTLTNKTLNGISIANAKVGGLSGGGLFLDSSSNEILQFTSETSAVNHIVLKNGINETEISTTGDSDHVDLALTTKGGDGQVRIDSRLVLTTDTTHSDGGTIGLEKPVQIFNEGSAIAVTLPNGDATNYGLQQFLISKGAGAITVSGAFADSGATGTTLTLSQNTSAHCIWEGNNWHLLHNSGIIS